MHAEQDYSDAELVENIRQPEKMNDAIKFLYKEYYSLLENYIVNNNGNRDDAADIIQETIIAFIEIVEANKFRGESSIKSFLFSIMRNLWLTELRKKSSANNRNKIFEQSKDMTEQEVAQH